MKYMLLFLLQFAAFTCFADVSQPQSPIKKPLEAPQFSILRSLIYDADLHGIFIGTGPFTIFAPNNAAFEKLGKQKLAELRKPQNKDHLADLLMYHVIPGKYMSVNLKSMEIQTVEGRKINITSNNGQIKVNNANVVKKDIVGPNGVLYEIDTVLTPP